jgi:isocitrate dehydrogenase kinase/phosphatase
VATTAAATRASVAGQIAHALIEGFDRHYRLFRETSAKAKQRFEAGDWADAQRAVKERIRFYDQRVREGVERLREEFDADALDDATWHEAKLRYIALLLDHKRPELAETFFNSVTTRILRRRYVQNELMFVRAAVSTEDIEPDPPTYRSYHPSDEGLHATFARIFRDVGWQRPFANLERDVEHLVRTLLDSADKRPPLDSGRHVQLQVLGSAFYRNKASYVIGKIVDGDRETPFAVPVLHDEAGRLTLDTVLLDSESMSILFSLSRSYFMVDMDVPSGYVRFLRTVMPTKPRSELYTALGLGKQGKTLFFRDLLHHLHHSEDLFVEAPGTPGQVMHVFTLPSYPYVFKVIKDRFGPSKHTTRELVKRKFGMIKDVDRVGRMVDAYEFRDLALPRSRFAPGLLAQLEDVAASVVERNERDVIVKHCYVERRMTPLNLYLERATREQLERAVRDFGDAIRELAFANIFTGDMLWRNFGVNRHGRVLFYDYDEIEYVTDCVFRSLPAAPNPDDELSDEAWYGVSTRDIFPEEFHTFMLGNAAVRDAFLRDHRDLLTPEFWRECQRRVAVGEVLDFFPYPEAARFSRRYG